MTLGVGALKVSAAPPSFEKDFASPLTKGDISVVKSESMEVKSSQSLKENVRKLLTPSISNSGHL
ncbi:MAG: hypothetical protein LBI53_02920 [Candidatus Peribacteria bacterium]|nr:hypothetical protein [Candidatus Peribacteria bacterium]